MDAVIQLAVQLLVLAGNASVMQAQPSAHLLLDKREVVAPVSIEAQAGVLPSEAVAHSLGKRTAMMLVERSDLAMCAVGDRDLRLMGLLVQRDELAHTVCRQQYSHKIVGVKIEVLRVSLDVMVADGVQPSQANGDCFFAYAAQDREAAAVVIEEGALCFAVDPVIELVRVDVHAHTVAVLGVVGLEGDEAAGGLDGDDGVASEVGVHRDPPYFWSWVDMKQGMPYNKSIPQVLVWI